MLNSRQVLSRKTLFLALGVVSVMAIANTLFSLEHDWHLLSITTLAIGGTLLFVNVRQSLATVLDRPTVLDRSYLFKELQLVQQAIGKIADSSQRQTFNEQVQQITNNLQKNHFRIVIFGTGSSGKTSVVNALLDRKAGKTAATIGTTLNRQEYAYQGIDFSAVGIAPIHTETHFKRQISLLDTPGVQEMGAMGQQRELEALQLAHNADLMVFVTSGDLTNTEYRELDRLAGIGKRVILAFNKIDLYLPSDRAEVLAKLKERTQQFLGETDIVAIAAQPSPIKVRQYANSDAADSSAAIQEWWEDVPPDVLALKERIENILSNEWETLLLDNTQLQIESLLQEINGKLNQERRQDATTIINRYQLVAATTVFANPIPAIDMLAGAAINTQMLIDLAKIYDRPLNFKQAQKFALTIAQQLLQLGCVEIATSAIASCFKMNALTYAIGGSMQAVTAAYLTHIGGISFVEYLEGQSESQTAIDASSEATNALQQLCQTTFKTLQGDRFVMDFVTNISRRLMTS
jgi:small GTP-binding protein